MCIYCYTYIQLNDFWIKMYGLNFNKKYYICINNWSQLFIQKSFTLSHMMNLIKDLHLEKEVSLNIDENIDEDENMWIQRTSYFDYCLENFKKGQPDIVKSVGKIMPTEIMDKIIAPCGKNNCKSILIKFLSSTQYAYETDLNFD